MKLNVAKTLVSLSTLLVFSLPASAQTTVNTNGTSGNWSSSSVWSGGTVPNNSGPNTYDVNILNTPSTVGITLDINATVSSLSIASGSFLQALGGGYTLGVTGNVDNSGQIYTAGFGGNTLNVNGTLTNESGADLYLYSTGDVATINTLDNQGSVTVGFGANLNLTNGLTDIAAGSSLGVYGTMNGLSGLTTIDGNLTLHNSQTMSVTPGGGILTVSNIGFLDTFSGVLNIAGNLNNSGSVSSGGTLNLTGNFMNGMGAQLDIGPAGTVNVNSFNNEGDLTVFSGSTLNITGGGPGITDVVAGSNIQLLGNLNVTNASTTTNAFANLGSVEGSLFLENGQIANDTPGSGTLTVSNTGVLELDAGTTGTVLNIYGNVDNSGQVRTSFFGPSGNTINVNRDFVNEANARISLGGFGDTLNVSSFTNNGSLWVAGGATINITGGGLGITDVVAGSSIYLQGNLEVTNGSNTTSALANLRNVEGSLTLANIQTTTVMPGTGTLSVSSSGFLEPYGSVLNVIGNLTNSGYTQAYNGGVLNISGNADNQGLMATLNAGTITVDGNLTNESSGALFLQSYFDMVQIKQSLANGGVVYVSPGALLAVGTGTLNHAFGYQQFADGTLNELIEGSPSSELFGFVSVDGSISLDGALDVSLQNGFTPTIGETFDILNFTPGDLSGTWSGIGDDVFDDGSEKWVLNYDNGLGEILLEAESTSSTSPTPEPTSLLLLGTGLLGLGIFGRRRLGLPCEWREE